MIATFFADLLATLLARLGGDISSYIEQVRKTNAERADRLALTQASVQPLKDAKDDDGDAIDKAADDALRHT